MEHREVWSVISILLSFTPLKERDGRKLDQSWGFAMC